MLSPGAPRLMTGFRVKGEIELRCGLMASSPNWGPFSCSSQVPRHFASGQKKHGVANFADGVDVDRPPCAVNLGLARLELQAQLHRLGLAVS